MKTNTKPTRQVGRIRGKSVSTAGISVYPTHYMKTCDTPHTAHTANSVPYQGSTLRLLNYLPTGQAPLQFDLPECKIYLPDVVFMTPNQAGPTFPEMKI